MLFLSFVYGRRRLLHRRLSKRSSCTRAVQKDFRLYRVIVHSLEIKQTHVSRFKHDSVT